MTSHQPIFRSIEVGAGQHVELGQPLAPDVRALMSTSDPAATQLQMKVGTFGNAQSIIVDLAPTDLHVTEIEFTYTAGTQYSDELAAYSELLGQPNQTGTVPDSQQSAIWQDTFTLFEVWERDGNVGSQLQDLEPV